MLPKTRIVGWTNLNWSAIETSLEIFLHACFDGDLLEQAHKKRPESSWVVEVITNVTVFINKLVDVRIGCGLFLSGFIVNNKSLHCLK